jgi:vacuolar-type H+-ATPase subunit E/Vma4
MSETSKFTEDILKSARDKAEGIIREAETDTERASEEAKNTISRQADEIVRNARADADAVRRRQVSEARHRTKLREEQEKDKIVNDVLEQVKQRAFQVVTDETKYVPLLVHLIESGIRELESNSAMVHLNRTDLERKTSLEQRISNDIGTIKVEWSKQPIEATGGVIISSLDGKIRIVNTLDQRFDAFEPRLLVEARASLFGE